MATPARRLVTSPKHACRFCGSALSHSFVDLGATPPANSYLRAEDLDECESYFALHALVCGSCWLVQLPAMRTPEQLFSDYAYFSSFSQSWLRHAEAYAEMMIQRFGFDGDALAVEIASNDGYLLQFFKQRGVDILGVEPAANVAQAAQAKGIPTEVSFFGRETATRLGADGRTADLVIGNNVLAHVPDLNDFVAGIQIVLKPEGVVTIEFPHLLRLIEENQFDTIYHEHFSYFSFLTVERVFAAHGMKMFDVEELPTHGGSLRIFACHAEAGRPVGDNVARLRADERAAGLDGFDAYEGFAERVKETKRRLLAFLIEAKDAGKSIAGYGAPAKGNTLLNFCGIGTEFIDYTVDRSPHKQGHFLPGSRIPIHAPETLKETQPDYVLILPWNLKDEIMADHAYIADWGGRFVTPIPTVTVHG